MEKKGIWKKVLSVLFALGMAIVLLPGMRVTVKADGDPTPTEVQIKEEWGPDDNYLVESDLPEFEKGTEEFALNWEAPKSKNGSYLFLYTFDDGGKVKWKYAYYNAEGKINGGINVSIVLHSTIYSLKNRWGQPVYYMKKTTPSSDTSNEAAPAPAPKQEQDQTLITGYIVNGKDANGNDTYATFSQDNVWSVTKVTSNANSVTYDIKPQWETYGTVHVGIPALGFSDGAVLVDHYKNGKLIATYNGWVTWEWCEFDNPDGFSTFVIRKPGTTAQTTKRAYVPNTGVK